MANKLLTIAIASIIIAVALAGFIGGFYYNSRAVVVTGGATTNIELGDSGREKSISIAAVDEQGRGLISQLTVDVIPGKGRMLVNINDVLANPDTQQSARNATLAAQNYLDKSFNNIDVIYSIKSKASLVAGESAGAAMATALVLALEDKELNDKVIISGTISPEGNIGKVTDLPAKVTAASEEGAILFLVPEGQSVQAVSNNCMNKSNQELCEVSYKTIDLRELGIPISEVNNLGDALKYF